MTDVQRALRAEERQAWQRLVRVLGHEINNSLGPISSIAETLRTGLTQPRTTTSITTLPAASRSSSAAPPPSRGS